MTTDELRVKVRKAIQLRGMTFKAAAQAAGFSERHLQKFLAGGADLTTTKLFDLCDAIGMPVEAVLHLDVK